MFVLKRTLAWLALLGFLVACGGAKPTPVYQIVRVRVTATPESAQSATEINPPLAIPERSATPTPTVQPASVVGDLRAIRLQPPVPRGGAPCGLVDLLDFPLEPPDAVSARGGADFGVYRGRYEKYHAGEDWGVGSGSNFGAPVYTIGHGVVTYAQPLGWGADQGVVIVRHAFQDGDSLLSFYGHLDPPSVTLRSGECVARGDPIGRIGRPRGFPHLHFELRTQWPTLPGPGYWPVDPTRAGWMPPSETIWAFRNATSPGVRWARPPAGAHGLALGIVGEQLLVTMGGGQLVGVNLADGGLRWSVPISNTVSAGTMAVQGDTAYLADQSGRVMAYRLPDLSPESDVGGAAASPVRSWQLALNLSGQPELMPLPGGGLLAMIDGFQIAVSPTGERLWSARAPAPVVSWALVEGRLIYATAGSDGSVRMVTSAGLLPGVVRQGGRLALVGEQLYLIGLDGVYSLDLETRSAARIVPLPKSFLGTGGASPLADGGLLLLLSDPSDRRLVALAQDGSLRWQRSLSQLPAGEIGLQIVGRHAYLLLHGTSRAGRRVAVYSLDPETASLNLVFEGGTRNSVTGENWALGWGDSGLLIYIGGGDLVALDLEAARTIQYTTLDAP